MGITMGIIYTRNESLKGREWRGSSQQCPLNDNDVVLIIIIVPSATTAQAEQEQQEADRRTAQQHRELQHTKTKIAQHRAWAPRGGHARHPPQTRLV